jgi:hypothetical protein
MDYTNFLEFFIGHAIFAIIGTFILFFFLAAYIYFSFAWMTIAQKLKYKRPELAWIPFVNIAMILQIGNFHWAWVFLLFIPIVGWAALWVLMIIATWRIFEKRKYPGWFSLSMAIPKVGWILYFIIIGFAAWEDKPKTRTSRKRNPKKRK